MHRNSFLDEVKEDEAQKITSLYHKKKTEILIPEIKTLVPVTSEQPGVLNPAAKKATNEESESTAHSMNGESASKAPPKPKAVAAPQ